MICVYDKHTPQDGFNNCGLRILNPVSAYITEELNGKYSYEVTCPMVKDDDSWTFLKPFNLLKSSTGQIFQIYKIITSTSGGVPVITAYADHIWYYLADMFVVHAEDTREAHWAMAHIFKELNRPQGGAYFDFSEDKATLFSHGQGLTDYNFQWSVNLDGMRHYKFDCVPLAYAILGSPDSIVNQWEGYLHRDNFRFSINKDKKEGAVDNAFWLDYGYNCSEVKYTYDFSNQRTEHWAFDGKLERYFAWAQDASPGYFPHQVISAAKYTLAETNWNQEVADLANMCGRYVQEHLDPDKTYEVNFVDPKGTSFDASGWGILRNLRVGDRGWITSIDGVRSEQQIISTKYNDVTERVDSLKLGKFIRSQLHQSRIDDIMYGDDSAARRLDKLEKRMDYFELVKGD